MDDLRIEENYKETIELYELADMYVTIEAEYISDSTEHEELNITAKLNNEVLANDEDSVLGLLELSSNIEMNKIGYDLELWLKEKREEKNSSYREEAEMQANKEELDELNAEYWSTR